MWSVRTLDRNISTQYFERHFKQPQILENPENKVAPDKLEILKSPIMAEFLGFKHDTDFSETELEKGTNHPPRCWADGHVCADV